MSVRFLSEQTSGIWREHSDAHVTSRCYRPQGCGGLICPGQPFYHNRMHGISIHRACAAKWHEKVKAGGEP